MSRDVQSNSPPVTLLFHDDELGDVRSLLGELGTPFVERRGTLEDDDRGEPWGLVVATPQRMLDIGFGASHKPGSQIAIVDRDSRTLRNSLRRHGIDLIVRRPVHPAALRALIVHALYKGPEKRRNVRVSVGAPVVFRAGWRQRPAILADLSMGGFRLLTSHKVDPGKSITLAIPAEVSAGKAFSVKGRVLRTTSAEGEDHLMACFDVLKASQVENLRRTIRTHATGPAQLECDASPALPACDEAPEESASAPSVARTQAPPAAPAPEPAPAATPEPEPEPSDPSERRDGARHHIDRRVIALGEEATRVLMGRDISIGGMRVNANPLLKVGENVRLAIHVTGQEVPLVVTARVHRDDGERGCVLRFHQMGATEGQQLNHMLETLPVLESEGADVESGVIISEILPEQASA